MKEVITDCARIETNVDNLTAESRDQQAQITSLKTELSEVKGHIVTPAGCSASRRADNATAARAHSAAPTVGGHSVRSSVTWKPTQVTVYNFCAFGSDAGALTRKERDEKGAFIISKLSSEVAAGVSLEKKYPLTRQLVFNVADGGEACWILREAILEMTDSEIKGFKLPIPGEEPAADQEYLKVRVEDHPEKKQKRGFFFRALRALERQFPRTTHAEKDIIVDVRFLKVHAGPLHTSLGSITAAGWTWDEHACVTALGSNLDFAQLRRDSMRDDN